MELTFFKAAVGLYTIATTLALAYLFSKRESFTLWLWRLLGVALLCHLASFGLRARTFWLVPENRYFLPINTFFGALSWLALANALVFWIVEGFSRLHILGAFVLPWTFLAAGAAVLLADPAVGSLTPTLQSYWINIHPMILMLCYAAFANSFGVGLALLIQERQIKSRKPTELCYRLPAIEELDELHLRIIAVFLPVLTLGIIMGGIWAYNEWGRFWRWDPKETWTAVTWALYVAYLHLRILRGVRGRATVYVAMAGFASVLFTFIGVNYLSAYHGYLSGGN